MEEQKRREQLRDQLRREVLRGEWARQLLSVLDAYQKNEVEIIHSRLLTVTTAEEAMKAACDYQALDRFIMNLKAEDAGGRIAANELEEA